MLGEAENGPIVASSTDSAENSIVFRTGNGIPFDGDLFDTGSQGADHGRIEIERTVIRGAQRQIRQGKDGLCIVVVGIDDAVVVISGIVAAAAGIALEEELVRVTDAAGIAVGDVYQIVLAVRHGDDIPHVVAGTGAVRHGSGDGVAGGAANVGEIAQILESLGITLTDHIGAIIVIKDPDQLPGVAVGHAAGRRGIVVRDLVANHLAIVVQHIVGGEARRIVYDGFGVVNRALHFLAESGVHGVGIAVAAVFLGNRKLDKVIPGQNHLSVICRHGSATGKPIAKPTRRSFLIPVQLIGAVLQ